MHGGIVLQYVHSEMFKVTGRNCMNIMKINIKFELKKNRQARVKTLLQWCRNWGGRGATGPPNIWQIS
mgnify:FL=1